MKKTLSAGIIALAVTIGNCYSQQKSGVYLSVEDFNKQHLSYSSDCNNARHAIQLNDAIVNKPYIFVVSEGKKIAIKKSELYGITDCDNNIYRFYNNIKYRMEEPGAIYIYSRAIRDIESKVFKLKTVYFFSVSADSEIIPLSLNNLKRAYAGNEKFIDQLDAVIGTREISEYDEFYKTYKVNHIYKVSLNK